MIGLVVALSACTGSPPDASDPDPSAPPATAQVTPPVTPPGTIPSDGTDLALVRELVDEGGDASAVLAQVAWSAGWPVIDGDSAWFVLVAEGGPWSIAGDDTDWAPVPMTEGDGFWWAEIPIGDPAGRRYKFTDGAAWIADPFARSYDYDDNGEISYVAAPVGAPRLDRWPAAGGLGLAPRDLRVFVPAGSGPWPVLYAHDGQNLFDPGAIWGGWRLQDALTARDPLLVVGIDNTVDRFDDYTHVPDDIGTGGAIGGDADLYAALIHDVIRPHVEATYGSTGLDGVLGSSLGGLASLVIAEQAPGEWDFAASLSGTLGWGRFELDEETIEERWLASPPAGTVVYVDSGGGPGDDGACLDLDGDGFAEDDPDSSDNYCETRQFADDLATAGLVWDQDLFHWWEPDATHDEVSWSLRVGRPLDLFLGLR